MSGAPLASAFATKGIVDEIKPSSIGLLTNHFFFLAFPSKRAAIHTAPDKT